MFNIIVGVFSIIGSIATIFSLSALISISNKISFKGNDNEVHTTIQTNKGKNNKNISGSGE